MPGCSRNWRRTSTTTVPAERPTARMASAEKMKAIEPPIRMPMNVVGCETLIEVAGRLIEPNALISLFFDHQIAPAAIDYRSDGDIGFPNFIHVANFNVRLRSSKRKAGRIR